MEANTTRSAVRVHVTEQPNGSWHTEIWTRQSNSEWLLQQCPREQSTFPTLAQAFNVVSRWAAACEMCDQLMVIAEQSNCTTYNELHLLAQAILADKFAAARAIGSGALETLKRDVSFACKKAIEHLPGA